MAARLPGRAHPGCPGPHPPLRAPAGRSGVGQIGRAAWGDWAPRGSPLARDGGAARDAWQIRLPGRRDSLWWAATGCVPPGGGTYRHLSHILGISSGHCSCDACFSASPSLGLCAEQLSPGAEFWSDFWQNFPGAANAPPLACRLGTASCRQDGCGRTQRREMRFSETFIGRACPSLSYPLTGLVQQICGRGGVRCPVSPSARHVHA